MKFLLIHLYLISLSVLGAQQCTEKFMQYSYLSYRSQRLASRKAGDSLNNEMRVLQEYQFNCSSTNITSLVLGVIVRTKTNTRIHYPSVKLYRDDGDQYTVVPGSERFIYYSTSNVSTSGVFEYLLNPPISVANGDLLAVSQPEERDSIVRVYYISDETGVSFSSSRDLRMSPVINDLILVYPKTDGYCIYSENSISESVIRENALQIHESRLPGERRQYIYPEIIFSCNGILTKWIYGGMNGNSNGILPELQIWRELGPNNYIKTGFSIVTTSNINSTNVYEYMPQPPLQFQAGDIFGFYIPQRRNAQLNLYEQKESGPNNLRVDSDNALSMINQPTAEGANDFPLVTVEVSIQQSSQIPSYTTQEIASSNGVYLSTYSITLNATNSGEANHDSALPALIVTTVMLTLIIVAIISVLILWYLIKRRKHKHNFHAPNTKLQTLANPIYSADNGQLPSKKIYDPPDYDMESSFYAEAGMPNPKAIDTGEYMEPVQSLPCAWGIIVPTMSQRCNITDHTKSLEIKNAIYAKNNTNDNFFSESEIYWTPGSDCSSIYDQLYKYKFRELIRDHINVGNHLGSGQFGSVSKGMWKSPTGSVNVAIKTLNGNTSEDERVKFLQEAAIMGQFHHPNIVKLYGMVTIEEPMMIILELMANGDMRKYLHTFQPQPGEMLPSTVPKLLLSFCRQIASGMEYLSKKSFVHRDLAARNILVAEKGVCKIADFGLSRDLQNENYYISKGGQIPIKWTAPEAIHYKKYSSASDAWSYGVLLYEIWSLGHRPFHNMTNQEAFRQVELGYRLPPPPGCPRPVYELMIQCWHPETSKRPSFANIVSRLSQSDDSLMKLSHIDKDTNSQAIVLGANIEAGQHLFIDLQRAYL